MFGKQTEILLLQLVRSSDLCVEVVEQFCVPRTWLIHVLGYVVDVVSSVVKHLGDDEGAFPGRSKLVRPFLIHSEHKVSFLECSTSDILGMESMQILLIDGRPNQSHLAFVFQEINCVFACLLCFSSERSSTRGALCSKSLGSTASTRTLGRKGFGQSTGLASFSAPIGRMVTQSPKLQQHA